LEDDCLEHEGGRRGGKKGKRKGEERREGGREEGREGGREGGRENSRDLHVCNEESLFVGGDVDAVEDASSSLFAVDEGRATMLTLGR
jgi:hypothetical protein